MELDGINGIIYNKETTKIVTNYYNQEAIYESF